MNHFSAEARYFDVNMNKDKSCVEVKLRIQSLKSFDTLSR